MNLLSAIGSTPLVELNNLNGNSKVRIFGKLEGSNPGGSIKDRPAYEMTRLLATKEGIFVGMSSGAAVVGALLVAKKMHSGIIVAILPDRGDRYLSTTLFRSICGKCPP